MISIDGCFKMKLREGAFVFFTLLAFVVLMFVVDYILRGFL